MGNSRYTFTYNEFRYEPEKIHSDVHENKQAQMSIDVADSATWEVPLREFCNFLSSIYGYDIASKVLEE